MRTSVARTLALGTASLAVVGGLVLPGVADAQTAQAGAVFSVSPGTASEGDTVVFSASGCELEGADQTALQIIVLDNVFADGVPVTDGNATYSWEIPAPAEFEPGTYQFTAYCFDTADAMGNGFTYEDTAELTIAAPAPSTTTTRAPAATTSTTAAPRAAASTATRPAFTG